MTKLFGALVSLGCLLTASAAPAAIEQKRETPLDKVIAALEALHPDEMSPREAMDALYALKTKLGETKKP